MKLTWSPCQDGPDDLHDPERAAVAIGTGEAVIDDQDAARVRR